jgi:Beta-propeller repeat
VRQMPYRIFAALALTAALPSAAVDGVMVAVSQPATLTDAVIGHRQVAGFGNLPIRFEPNVGQAPPQIEYSARGQGYFLAITEQGAILTLRPGTGPENAGKSAAHVITLSASRQVARLRLYPMHASPRPRIIAERQLASVSNYFIGNDPSRWHSNVANYAAVRYEQQYPGIDWLIYGNPQHLEYDFVVAPHSDPRRIRLRIEGADSLSLNDDGDLLIRIHDQIIRQLKPVIYQTAADGARHGIDGRYVLLHGHVAFALGDYDHSRQLVIDPAFVYSTYLGGSGGDAAAAIAVDGEGNAYVAGVTSSTDFPTVNPFQATNQSASATHSSNAFVTKLNAEGSQLVYSTYLGGSGVDTASGIAVDSVGNVYVVGSTSSTDFPTAAPFQATNHAVSPANYPTNAFVTKLSAAGDALVYSTYLGGSGPKGTEATYDGANAIAVDSAGNAYVVGQTASSDFPTLNPFQATNHTGGSVIGSNAFITKFNAAGSALVYSTYLGGSFSDGASAIAVDSAGSAYVVGSAGSTDFPTVAPFQATNNAAGAGLPAQFLGHFPTAFLTKFNPAGSALVYSTYLGGSCQDWAAGVAVDGDGNAYVAGATCSTDFPTVNPLQSTNHAVVPGTNPFNAFIAKVNAAGNGLVYSTYLGGSIDDRAGAIAVDSAGNAYVAGLTFSHDFPLAQPLQDMNNGAADVAANAFVSVLNATGSALMFSTYLGGSGSVAAAKEGGVDSAAALAVDSMGNLYVAGVTYSTNFPTAMAFQTTNKSTATAATSGTAFVTKIAADPDDPAPRGTGGGGALGWELIGILGCAASYRICARRQGQYRQRSDIA